MAASVFLLKVKLKVSIGNKSPLESKAKQVSRSKTICLVYGFIEEAFNTIKNFGKNCSSINDFEKDTLCNTVFYLLQNHIFVSLKTFFFLPL